MTAARWWLVLVAVVVIGPYVLGVRPRSARDWRAISLTLAFISWLLLGLTYRVLRSR